MIKLKLKSDPSKTFEFESLPISLKIENLGALSFHTFFQNDDVVRFVQDEEFFLILNVQNDPFITLNGEPFGKAIIHNGDLLQIGSESVDIEVTRLERKLHLSPKSAFKLELKEFQTLFGEEKIENISKKGKSSSEDMESLFEELESLLSYQENENSEDPLFEVDWNGDVILNSETLPEAPKEHQQEKGGTKEYHLSSLDDKEDALPAKIPLNLRGIWKFILVVFAALCVASAMIFAAIYLSVTDQTGIDEMVAAQGVADLAMGLKHAQVYKLKPHNDTWSDAEFLKENIRKVVSPKYSLKQIVNSHGQFVFTPYTLRIYTSNDLSQFVLIAQPNPNISQWIVPKGAILVDSHRMELRKIKDIRAINRALADPFALNSDPSNEVSQLIQEGELIRLASFALESGQLEFTPPKSLIWTKPGSENFLYNAPRYHPFTEPLIQKVYEVGKQSSNSHDLALLKQEFENFSGLKELVLYSLEGKKGAQKLREEFITFIPNAQLHFGFLLTNNHGLIVGSQLLKESFIPLEKNISHQEIAENDPLVEKKVQEELHPLTIQLLDIKKTRTEALGLLSKELSQLLADSNDKLIQNLEEHFTKLSKDYVHEVSHQNDKMVQKLIALQKDYNKMPIQKFLNFVQNAGLESYLLNPQGSQEEKYFIDMTPVSEASSLSRLYEEVKKISLKINFEQFPNFAFLSEAQKNLRNAVIIGLNKLLFSYHKQIKTEEKTASNEKKLKEILNDSWIVEPLEQEFYLNQFKTLTKKI